MLHLFSGTRLRQVVDLTKSFTDCVVALMNTMPENVKNAVLVLKYLKNKFIQTQVGESKDRKHEKTK